MSNNLVEKCPIKVKEHKKVRISNNASDIGDMLTVNIGELLSGKIDKLPKIFFAAMRDSLNTIESINENL